MHLGLHWWEHSWLLHKVFCCGLVLVFFGDLVVSKKRRIWSVFDFVPVRLSTISYLYSWIGLWTLNLLRFSVIYLLCTGFLSLSIFWQGRCHSAWHQLLRARNSSSPPPLPWEIRDFKQQRWRRLAKRHLKSEFALLETLSRLFHLAQFVKCWQSFSTWVLKDCIKVQEKKKKVAVLCSRPRQNVMHVQSCCFGNINLVLFCRSRWRRDRRYLSFLKTTTSGTTFSTLPGGVLGLIFGGYVPLACQSLYSIIVYSVANYRRYFSHV